MDVMKRMRQQAIEDVVRRRGIRTQQELVAALAELGLVKVHRDGAHVYAPATSAGARESGGEQRLGELLHDLPVDIRPSGPLVVIRAVPGTAHAIAAALDRARWPEVLGTIAGDDTLFVACADARAVTRTLRRLRRLGR